MLFWVCSGRLPQEIKWRYENGAADSSGYWWSLPVIAETWDGYLNDINGFHVKERHAFEALESAASGPVTEGAVGGGTGMICYGFKGGIGTASRVLTVATRPYTLGVLVQANFGRRNQLRIAGAPETSVTSRNRRREGRPASRRRRVPPRRSCTPSRR